MTDAVLGIDVCKNTFDASLGAGTKVRSKSFTNSSDGWHQLIAWLGEPALIASYWSASTAWEKSWLASFWPNCRVPISLAPALRSLPMRV